LLSDVICISESAKSELILSKYFSIHAQVIYPYVKSGECYQRKEATSLLGLPDYGGYTIWTIANNRPVKGLNRIQSILENLMYVDAPIRWVLIGEGTRAFTHTDEVNGRFVVGVGPFENASSVLSICDLYFQPSLNEGLSFSTVEAGLYGLPCVVSKVGGLKEAIYPDSDCLIEGEGHQYISNAALAITQLLSDNDLRVMFGNRNRKFCEDRFSKYRYIENTINVLLK